MPTRCLTLLILASFLLAQPPAGSRPPLRAESGTSILPGGREITPVGDQFFTGPGPFGLAVSANGRYVVTADGGPNRYALTILSGGKVSQIPARHKRDASGADADDDDADWNSVFMGLAFDGDHLLYASEGESGKVRLIDIETGKRVARFDLNQSGFKDSYSGDMAFDSVRGVLYVVDQANFRLVSIDTRARKILGSVKTGRLPFAVALSPDTGTAYVANLGVFEYQAVPGADLQRAKETGLPFPAFGFPSPESAKGVTRQTEQGAVKVPALGNPNVRGANSIATIDVTNPSKLRVVSQIPTGLPFGGNVKGGSSPSGVIAVDDAVGNNVYVANANQDTISVLDARTGKREPDIPLRMAGFEGFRGVLPIGLTATSKWVLVAEAGINAIGVIDRATRQVIGHIPAGWFPTQVKVQGETVFVANAKGHGTGPNADPEKAFARSFQGELRRGTISRFEIPAAGDLPKLTAQVVRNNGFSASTPGDLPPEIDYVVIIVKENRTYDEILGDLPAAANGARNGAAGIARWGEKVTPNHHALAKRFSSSDNFYADSEVSVDGHHWLVGSYPNAWTTSSLMAAYGGEKSFRFPTTAPGRLLFAESAGSLHPEEQLEAGAIWHHLERNGIGFLNFGEGFELAGVRETENLEPTGARFLTNVPMPDPLYRNTSRRYPGFNMNIPDQHRASQFIAEIDERFVRTGATLPRLLFIHLPNDHTAKKRPENGYPSEASYVADNDLALGRIVEYLSHGAWWPKMAVFVTEDDAQSGVDHVDSHRTLLLVASPYARRDYTSRINTSFPGLIKTALRLLRLPPLNLYDATAADLADCFTPVADITPYQAVPVDPSLFDPKKARVGKGAGPKMDDPAEIRRQHRRID
jgi:DNA-binding beta-propeller fold protein YncE